MSATFTKKCVTTVTGGVAKGHTSQLAFRALAADAHDEVHLVDDYRGPLSLKDYLEGMGLAYDPDLVESWRV